MTSRDIYKMYKNAEKNRRCLGTVINPKYEKNPSCVILTDEGFNEIHELITQAAEAGVDEENYVIEHNSKSNTEFYTAAPFSLTSQPCHVTDLRDEDETFNCLYEFITTGGNLVDKWHKSIKDNDLFFKLKQGPLS